jgi:glycerol-3-phosphate dehydrogenase (NAD(P)+)
VTLEPSKPNLRVSVIGAGSWGTALAIMAARGGHDVKLWSRNTGVVMSIQRARTNSIYLTGIEVPENVFVSSDLSPVLRDADLVVMAAPSHVVRSLLERIGGEIAERIVLVNSAKGIEVETGKRISEIAKEILPAGSPFVCLSGPSFAKEVVLDHPTAIVAASSDPEAARFVQTAMSYKNFRVYTNSDVIGTELGGSVKNVMAIGAGMVSGLGLGANSLAALITRGLAEITRLAISQGGQLETMMGLAGLGDLVLTCTGSLSRNRFVGEQLARGKTIAEITTEMTEVAEGLNTTRAVKTLADLSGVEMPIVNEVNDVLYRGKSVRDAVNALMSRPLRDEI